MKTVVNNIEFSFEKWNELNSKIWCATIRLSKYELDFIFNETLFWIDETNELKIDWKLIEKFIENVLNNIETIQEKGSEALEKLYGTLDFFEIGGIELKKFDEQYFEYKTTYFLEPKKHALVNTGLSHYVYFSYKNDILSINKATRI